MSKPLSITEFQPSAIFKTTQKETIPQQSFPRLLGLHFPSLHSNLAQPYCL